MFKVISSISALIGKLVPKSIKKKIGVMLKKAGKDEIPEEWIGGTILLAFFYALICTLVLFLLVNLSLLKSLVMGILVFSIVFSLYYFTMYNAMLKAQKADLLKPKKTMFLDKRFFVRLYHSISKAYPLDFREHIRETLFYTGDRLTTPEHWIGIVSILSVLYSIVLTILVAFTFKPLFILLLPVFAGSFILLLFLQYMLTYYKAENRRKKVEEVLPDFLQLISANIRAGMTPFAALRSSARDEFGPLAPEVEYATAKSLGTASFTDALEGMSETINSKVLGRVIGLFASGLKSGGKLSALLENAAQDISQTQELNAQLVSSTRMYMMFILFNIAVGSPLMLAISMQFVEMVQEFQDMGGSGEVMEQLGGLSAGGSALSTTFLFNASIGIITITCFIASGFIGVINEGNMRNGFKFFPPLALFSIGAYLVFRIFVGGLVSSMI